MGKAGQKKPTIAGSGKVRLGEQSPVPPGIDTSQPILTKPLPVFFLLALLATLIYSNTFSVPFVFDDTRNIVENPRIKDLKNFLDFSGTRYIGFLSFALNYYFGGLNLFGYHLVNLTIHIANGFLVYLLVSLLLRTPRITSPYIKVQSPWIGFATALLFISHPIQTQAVTYIVQRFASLATLFYLLAVVCYLTWRLAPSERRSRYLWYCASLLSTVLAMKTKEISFTLPMMLMLIETVFFQELERKNWISLIPFLLTLLIIPLSRIDVAGGTEQGFAQETTAIHRSHYLFTQFRVIMTYLRLLILPVNQNLDYAYPIHHSFFELPVLLSFLFLSALLGLSIYLAFVSSSEPLRLIGFGMLWFFLTLSIESSIIPIRDVIFEHRLYLPSIGFFFSGTIGVNIGLQGLSTTHPARSTLSAISFLIVFSFSLTTYQRNGVWKDIVTLWEDVVRKAPKNVRARNNLGIQYKTAGRFEDAIQEYRVALELKPDFAEGHNNLGVVLKEQGKPEEAIKHYILALQFRPDYLEAHMNLGSTLGKQGKLDEAIPHFLNALRINPNSAVTHNELGVALAKQGKLNEAITHFSMALKINPAFGIAYNHLGLVFYKTGQLDEAEREFKNALEIDPQFSEARENLKIVNRAKGAIRNVDH